MSVEKIDSVKTAARTLDLFEAFARTREPMSLSDLSQQIGSPVSSTHALVKTLRARGFLYVLEDRRLIYPTKRLLAIAARISEKDPVVEIALPIMTRLQERSDETIIFGKRQNSYVVYLEVIECRNAIRYSARPGDTKPLHSSAIGKAMISLLPEKDLLALLKRDGQKKVTNNTIVEPEALLRNLAEGREREAFVTRGENVVDVMAVATPVWIDNEPYGLAIAGPIARMLKKEDACVAELIAARDELSRLNEVTQFASTSI